MTKLKHRHIEWLRQNRLTRHIHPTVCTEDLVLCALYRNPYQHLVSGVKVEYISTVTGQVLLTRLHVCDAAGDSPLLHTTEPGSPERLAAAKAASYPTLQALALFYREQAQESPERAQEVQATREHIARLRHIPRSATDRVQSDLISKWCEQRTLELNPNRQLTTRQLEHQFDKTKQELLQLRREIKQLEENIQPLRDALDARKSCIKDLTAELRVRPDRILDLEAADKQINPPGLYRVRTA